MKDLTIPQIERIQKLSQRTINATFSQHFPSATPPQISQGMIRAILEAAEKVANESKS